MDPHDNTREPGDVAAEGGSEPIAPPAEPKPGLFARAMEVWRNPAYRFVLLFLLYLLIAAAFYPPFTRHFPDVVYGMMTITAELEEAGITEAPKLSTRG